MKTSLPVLTFALFLVCSNSVWADCSKDSILRDVSLVKNDSLRKKDKSAEPHSLKICACQVLQLQSLNHKPKNYALYAERTNRKSYTYDVHKAKWILEKEKKHLADFFYDKLDVLDDIVEITDCKSLFIKMKKKHRTLILYDILDADVKR